jgi:release factor glutamine methyltransferase
MGVLRPSEKGTTIAAAIRDAARRLVAAGIDDPGADARRLAGHALGLDALALTLRADDVLDPEDQTRFEACIARRLAREPVSRILGRREFYGRSFRISPATLDPRPETETLIDAALEHAAGVAYVRILDIGTGSGCIALTLLDRLPGATAIATDISAAALDVAADNAARLTLDGRIDFRQCDFAAGVAGPFDLVVSNPPYIPTGEIPSLAPEVRDNDPWAALDGGQDGLDPYRVITRSAASLIGDGSLILEIGHDQAHPVAGLLRDAFGPRLIELETRRDLAGHDRCVAAKIRRSP